VAVGTGLHAEARAFVSSDAHGSADLYAAWASIFEQMRVVEGGGDRFGSHSARDDQAWRFERPALVGETAVAVSRANAIVGAARATGERRASAVTGMFSELRNPCSTAPDSPSAATNVLAAVTGTASAVPQVLSKVPAQRAESARAASAVHDHAGVNDPPPGAASSPPAGELITVFRQGAHITIVVRNPTLSDSDALQSAFDTAFHLSGQRTALKQLTLNGRTLYRHLHDSAPRGASSDAPLAFAC
jgi:hypothetical protein